MTIPTNKRTNAVIKSFVELFMEAIIKLRVRVMQLPLVMNSGVGENV
jgi:hypothetical protein